ncbi:hypothetical protein Tco_1394227 [Tanacetum coccineum]
MPPRKRACLTTPAPRLEIEESSTVGAARQLRTTLEAMMEVASTTLEGVNQRVMELATIIRQENEELQKMAPRKRTTRASPATTTTPTSTPITDAQLRTLIERGVAAVLAERDANRIKNGDDNHDSGIGRRRQALLSVNALTQIS